jgi:hypothetical protein
LFQVLLKFIFWSDSELLEVLDKDALLGTFAHFEFRFLIKVEKIPKFFIIKFDERAQNKELLFRGGFGLEKYFFETPGNDTTILFRLEIAHHGMGLARASLSIGKNRSIVPLDYFINQFHANWLINLFLSTLGIKNIIKGENLIFSFITIDIGDE